MIIRQKYLDQLIAFQDQDLVKVVTGMRRTGKSTLLDMMRKHLANQGVPESRLPTFKMESMEFASVSDYRDLYAIVCERIKGVDKPYLFFDELQEVIGWERAINSLRVDLDCDIYITGSNAYLLSSELSTLLSGRYVEIEMQPLVFAEYLDFRGMRLFDPEGEQADLAHDSHGRIVTLDRLFTQFRQYGGLPFLALQEPKRDNHRTYCKSLYDTVVVRDILQRDKRRDRRRLTNPDLLKRICNFMADNVGNENSVNSISGVLRFEHLQAANDTVDAYIGALCQAYLFYPIQRYDIKGKELLKTNGKHYMVDTGLRNYLQGYNNSDPGRVLENLVFLQLKYDGYNVAIGKLRSAEVDFVATKDDERVYIQVAESITNAETRNRELRPLQAIADAYPKIVIVQDDDCPTNIDGIRIVKAADFLLNRISRDGIR
jgi:predicted AAA+ superfamily ATPase